MEGTPSIEGTPSMDLYFYFKGENGNLECKGPYSFENEALMVLVRDFAAYCDSSDSTKMKKGGWYKCKYKDNHRILFLKFEEIVYIG
jgi:hypothetical protein